MRAWNISPAPSQSEVVMMGVCTYRKPFSCRVGKHVGLVCQAQSAAGCRSTGHQDRSAGYVVAYAAGAQRRS